jgi:hypothetical protein
MTRAASLLLAFGLLAPLAAWAAGRPADPVAAAPAVTAPTIRESSAQLNALGPVDRAQAAAALRALTASCPYTRAAMLLPFVVQDAIAAMPDTAVAPAARAELAALRSALAGQVEALAALGVEVPAPAPGDALFGQPAARVPSRAALAAAADPVAAMSSSIQAIRPIAQGIDDATQATLDAHSARLEAATGLARPCPRGPWAVRPGHPWTLGLQRGEARAALARLSAAAVDAEARAQIDALVGLIDALAAADQDSRGGRAR